MGKQGPNFTERLGFAKTWDFFERKLETWKGLLATTKTRTPTERSKRRGGKEKRQFETVFGKVIRQRRTGSPESGT